MDCTHTTSTKKNWSENSFTKALLALEKDSNLRALWKSLLNNMYVTDFDNELFCKLLHLFVKKFTKRRCVTYLAVDGLGPSAHQHNLAIRQLLKRYDILVEKNIEGVTSSTDKSVSKCHGCGKVGHWVRDCPKGYNEDWLDQQKCFKCGQLGHFRRDCPFKITKQKSNSCSSFHTKLTVKPNHREWYQPSATLPKTICTLDGFDLEKR